MKQGVKTLFFYPRIERVLLFIFICVIMIVWNFTKDRRIPPYPQRSEKGLFYWNITPRVWLGD